MKVLVLDDDVLLREAMEWTLGFEGHEVVTFGKGQAALDYLKSHVVQFIVMDWNMPSMSGEEFLRRSAGLFLPLFTPTIAVVSGDFLARDHALSLGASHFLTKPFVPEGLADTVRIAA